MKLIKIQKAISIMCSVLGIILSLFGLTLGLQSIGANVFDQLGIIFIIPSIFVLLIIVFDFLITVGKIKKGLIYSCISTLVKIGITILLIPSTIYDYKYELQYGVSNLNFNLILIVFLVIIAIPSILNTISLSSLRKSNK